MRDVERDIEIAKSLIGKDAAYIKGIWEQFRSGWDGAWCSETACCISYMAGNVSLIPVANWAEGLYKKFLDMDRAGSEPLAGAFVFFGYGSQPDHTGRVIEIRPREIVTIEGNVHGKVVRRVWSRTDKYIFAYGYPKYTADPKAEFLQAGARVCDLYKGKEDDMVLWLQQVLKDKGYYIGDIDGKFGNYTESAVKSYQKDRKLVVDGVAGYYTISDILR